MDVEEKIMLFWKTFERFISSSVSVINPKFSESHIVGRNLIVCQCSVVVSSITMYMS